MILAILYWLFPRLPWPDPRVAGCKIVPKPMVRRLSKIVWRTHWARSAYASVTQDGKALFQGDVIANGSATVVPLTGDEIDVLVEARARFGGSVAMNRFTILPVSKPPRFRCSVPARAEANHDVLIRWRSRSASAINCEIEFAGQKIGYVGRPSDAFVWRPDRAGIGIVRFLVRGSHGAITVVRILNVTAKAPHIEIAERDMAGWPGHPVSFPYRIYGATDAWLEAKGERHPLVMKGLIETAIGREREEMRVVARGIGGTTLVNLSTVPSLYSSLVG
jgi:hypothetical protein